MKLTDYIVKFLESHGIHHTFGLTGGAVVHIFDSLAKSKTIAPIFTHHEQSASFAAEAYARINKNLGVCIVTTGPGGTNAITGLCAAWLDSIPCLFISGQQRLVHSNHKRPFRQLGSQQIDIVTLVSPISKYAVMIQDIRMIRYELEKAVYIAKSGRPGPVWLDIPLDMQWASIDPESLPTFHPEQEECVPEGDLKENVRKVREFISASKRPLVLLGHGVRLAHAEEVFIQFLEQYKLPVATTWNTLDMIPSGYPSYVGCAGIAAQRGANLAIQNCDLLLAIGSHLSMSITGTNFNSFAREAKKCVINIDPVQIENPTVSIDLPILADAKRFLEEIVKESSPIPNWSAWNHTCRSYQACNAVPKEWFHQKAFVNPYVFIDTLSEELSPTDQIVVDGGGTVLYMSFQGLKIKAGQRMIVSGAIGAMGSGLPESIGASFAAGRRRTLCMIGDGSMQFNIQELQTIVHHDLPIKIFLFNNSGYLSIRQTQDGFLARQYIGSHASQGLSVPDYQKIVPSYGIEAIRVTTHQNLRKTIREFLDKPGPGVCEIMVKEDQDLVPRMGFKNHADGTASGMPLEDMAPFLDREKFKSLMIIPPLEESLKQ